MVKAFNSDLHVKKVKNWLEPMVKAFADANREGFAGAKIKGAWKDEENTNRDQ